MNSITIQQNTKAQLSRLAAQRALYSRAKNVLAIQLILMIPLASAWSILANLAPSWKIWAALWGLSVALLDESVFDYLQSRWKECAAKIQEEFDCEVLNLPWNHSRVGVRPDPELVASASMTAKDTNDLDNWYSPSVSVLPLHAARIVCQRSNLWWDNHLRRAYSSVVLAITVLLFSLALFTGVYTHLTLEKFVLAVLAPLSPTLLWFIKEYRRQHAAIASLERLKEHLEQVWTRLLAGQLNEREASYESRSIQDGLYERRKNNPLIFDWVYRLGRSSQDLAMNAAADDLVRQFSATQAKPEASDAKE